MSGFQGDVTGEPILAPLKVGFDRRVVRRCRTIPKFTTNQPHP